MVAQKTLASFRERMNQLYEQGADVRCWAHYHDHPTTPESDVIYHILDYDR